MMQKIFIVILNYNGKSDTLECLNSLQAVTTSHDAVVVDNGSVDGSVSAIKERFPKTTVIESKKNLGYAEGNNVGVRYSLKKGADYIFILNNDTVVHPKILESFLKQSAPIQGAKAYLYGERDRLDHLGGMWNVKKGNFDLVANRDLDKAEWKKPVKVDYVCGCGIFIKREVFEKVGLFEPRFFLYWEESDLCFRASKRGYQILTCPEAIVWHKVARSFKGDKEHITYFWWRNRLLWIERNCSKKETLQLSLKVLLPETFHLIKLALIKTLELFFLKIFAKKNCYLEKKIKLKNYIASLMGIRDYLLRRFGKSPFF